ncbi:MAG TPA: hypothetical protein VHU84_17040, partial [Lacipirellulaceae bacterium]|nr:hypothetical protein [Lacipirellulaceae bacterium]
YSPILGLYRTDPAFSFEFQLTPLDAVPGDYNSDGVVDTADYVVWRSEVGMSGTNLAADGNGDHLVNILDLGYWRQRLGNSRVGSGAGQAAAVPEPSCIMIIALLAGALSMSRIRLPHSHLRTA